MWIMKEEVIDLRHFRARQLDPLWSEQAAEWRRDLRWDYASTLTLVRQYIESRLLSGYVLTGGGREPLGYGFFIYDSGKGIIGDLYIRPEMRSEARSHRLLEAMLETLQSTPGLQRVEAQIMTYRPAELEAIFRASGFAAHRRKFMFQTIEAMPVEISASELTARMTPWSGEAMDAAAQLIVEAYNNSVDAEINDHYRTRAGALRFLHNLVRFPGCGFFDTGASWMVMGPDRLRGLILCSRVMPEVTHITQICVWPGARRQGLGQQLMLQARAALRGSGCQAWSLTVSAENTAALHLYESLGFTPLREFDAYVWVQ